MASDHTFEIAEFFTSVKGEGIMAGIPMLFVRMAGCNVPCGWCDTDFEKKIEMDEDAMFDYIRCQAPAWVVFTGGEPTLQPLTPLCRRLMVLGIKLMIESNGTNDHKMFHCMDHIAISPKGSAGVNARLVDRLTGMVTKPGSKTVAPTIEQRFLIMNKNDDRWITGLESISVLTFSPLARGSRGYPLIDPESDCLERCLELVQNYRHEGARLSVQVHKLIGVK